MIRILLKQKPGKLFVEARGHALFSSENDIVCASVSALIQNWKFSCDTLGKAVEVEDFKSGSFSAQSSDDLPNLILWKSLALGLQMIAARYPENMKIILEESNGS